jgi:hypothetical protein
MGCSAAAGCVGSTSAEDWARPDFRIVTIMMSMEMGQINDSKAGALAVTISRAAGMAR